MRCQRCYHTGAIWEPRDTDIVPVPCPECAGTGVADCCGGLQAHGEAAYRQAWTNERNGSAIMNEDAPSPLTRPQ